MPPPHLRTVFRGLILVLAALAAAKLTDEFLRLAWRTGPSAGIDFRLRYREVNEWFAGIAVYRKRPGTAAYPPATYALLWPFAGWLELRAARVLWAIVTLASLAWLSLLLVRESGAADPWQRAFVVLMALAMNQTGVAVGNGQLILPILPPLLLAVLLVQRGRGRWAQDLAAAACALFALLKITVAVPFLWLMLLARAGGRSTRRAMPRLRPALLVAAGYAALTVFASAFQRGGLPPLLGEWLSVAKTMPQRGGYANVHDWLSGIGLEAVILPASAVVLLALGIWLWHYDRADLWVRIGVVALVARFWTYHMLYDDVVVVLAMLPLFRLAASTCRAADRDRALAPSGSADSPAAATLGSRTAGLRVPAAVVLGTTMLVMVLPARMGASPGLWRLLFNGSHTLAWFAMLAVLLRYAHLQNREVLTAAHSSSRTRAST